MWWCVLVNNSRLSDFYCPFTIKTFQYSIRVFMSIHGNLLMVCLCTVQVGSATVVLDHSSFFIIKHSSLLLASGHFCLNWNLRAFEAVFSALCSLSRHLVILLKLRLDYMYSGVIVLKKIVYLRHLQIYKCNIKSKLSFSDRLCT